MEIFGGGKLENERAGEIQIDHDATVESRDGYCGVHPQQRLHCSTPALRSAEKVEQLLLLLGNISALGGLDLNLAPQGKGMDWFFAIAYAQLQGDQGNSSMRYGFGAFNLKLQVRHGSALLLLRCAL